jgi:predicted CXXCH cytochrome family protein
MSAGTRHVIEEHPVGIEYARGQFSSAGRRQDDNTANNTSPQNRRPKTDFNAPQRDVIDGQVIWWLGSGGIREKEDVQLFTRIGPDGQAAPYIECASCHDPHAVRINLLRRDNRGSRLCLSCHNN